MNLSSLGLMKGYVCWSLKREGWRGQGKVKERINKRVCFGFGLCWWWLLHAVWIPNAAHLDLPPSGNLLQRPTSDVPVLGQVREFLPVGCCDGLPGHFLQALVCPLCRHATLQLSGSSSHTYAAICPLLSSEVTAPPTGWRIKKYSNYNPKTDPEIHVLG